MRILMITPLDYTTFDNIEHYMVRYYRDCGDQVTMMSKTMNRSTSFRAMVWQTVTCTSARRRADGFELILVDPLFNYYAGLRRSIEARTESGVRTLPSVPTRALRTAARLATPLSVLRDLFFLPCFLATALIRCEGRYDVAIGFGPWG